MDYKTCSKCKKSKPVTEFTFTGGRYYSQCKQCKREYAANRWRNDPEYRKKQKQKDRGDYGKDYMRKKRQDPEFREQHKQYMKDYHIRVDSTAKARERRKDPEIREKERLSSQKYRDKHPEKLKTASRKSNIKRRGTDKYKLWRNDYEKDKRENDIEYRILISCRNKINKALSRKNNTSKELIGCKIDYLIEYLEDLFNDNMSWNNYGDYWHIDHIVPCNYFDFSKDDDIKICFNYRNLQPLPAAENCSKQDKLPDDYQEIIEGIKKALHIK